MKKALFISIIATLLCGAIWAQQIKKPFFGKVKDVEVETPANSRGIIARVTPTDSTFMNLRPVTGVAYSFPNNQAQGFAGVSYGNTTYNYKTKESYINWSVDVVYSLGKTTVEDKIESEGSSFGFGVFALNRNVGILVLWNKYKKVVDPDPAKYKPVVAVSWGINL